MNKKRKLRDVNPQWLKAGLVQTGANATTTSTVNLPIDPTSGSSNPVILEILKVIFDLDGNAPAAVTSSVSVSLGLTTKSTGMDVAAGINSYSADPYVFAFAAWDHFAFATSVDSMTTTPQVVDLTDGQGNGVLVAVPKVYLTMASTALAAAAYGKVQILYRYKQANLTEWIGLVQSQQSGN